MKSGIIFTIFLHFVLYSEHMFVKGTFDFDQDGRSEILLFNESRLRFVEIDDEGQHQLLWGLTPEYYSIKDAFIVDLQNNGINDLIVLTEYSPDFLSKNTEWLKLFSWSQSQFELVDVELIKNKLMHPNNGDYESTSRRLSIAFGNPSRTVFFVQFNDGGTTDTINVQLPQSLHNGIGHLFARFMNVDGESHLAVFSNEGNLLNTGLFKLEKEPVIIAEKSLPLNNATNLLGPAIYKTDLDGDHTDELQLPFMNGVVQTLAFVDNNLTLTLSKFSRKELFVVPETASAETINNVLISRVESGLMSQRISDGVELESIVIIPNDTLYLGDTLFYRAVAGTGSGFYSFHWLSPPPVGARFDPTTGLITWAPSRSQLGIHEFKYFAEKSLKDELISDVDLFGDRYRMVPVIEENEQVYAVIVNDTAKTQIVYNPPRDEPYMIMVQTTEKKEGKKRFIFNGVPSFHVIVKEFPHPNYFQISHSISANLGSVEKNKSVNFSYSSSNQDSIINLMKLIINHDLNKNTIQARIEPSLDTTTISLNPENWKSELQTYPEYHFNGFPESMRLGESDKGISLYENENNQTSNQSSFISILTPNGGHTHTISIEMSEMELWNIRGDVTVDSSGGKRIRTSMTFSGEFDLLSVSAETNVEMDSLNQIREMKFKRLEYLGVESVVVDSGGAEMQ